MFSASLSAPLCVESGLGATTGNAISFPVQSCDAAISGVLLSQMTPRGPIWHQDRTNWIRRAEPESSVACISSAEHAKPGADRRKEER